MALDRQSIEEEFVALLRQPDALSFLDQVAFGGLWYWKSGKPSQEWISASFWKSLGYDPADALPDWRALVFPEDRALLVENFRRHVADRSHVLDQVLRFRAADQATITVRCQGVAIREAGKPLRMLGVHAVVRDTNADHLERQLTELVELSGDAVFAWCLRGGVRRWNRGAVGLFGFSSAMVEGQNPNDLTHAVFPGGWAAVQQRLEAGLPWSGEVERRRADGTTIVTSARLSPVEIDGDDVLILQIDRDMTAVHRNNERLRLLNRELNHRVKNLFAIVQGLVSVSGRGERDAAVVTDKIQARIAALAAAHMISIDDEEIRTISFKRVLQAVLAPYEQRNGRLTMRGVEARLPRRAVTPVGMIFHELATNAVKYGAWAADGGHLTVTWMADDDGGGDTVLHVRWVEHFPRLGSAAPLAPPGLGLPLIQQSARQLDGELTRTWSAEGMETLLSFSLKEAVGGGRLSSRPRLRGSAPKTVRERTDVH